MTVRGVLFDFSGTLFRFEPELDGLIGHNGEALDGEAQAEVVRRMTAPAGRPSSLPQRLHDEWGRRDLDPPLHRELYLAVLRGSGVANPEYLYEQLVSAGAWQPFPDTEAALTAVAAAGIPLAVVSNIAWDIRPVFERAGVAEQVNEFVLSYAEGVVKPDLRLFEIACGRIGIAPEKVLMIGDSYEADGAAAELGCAVTLVEPVPAHQRPSALVDALAEYGIR
ncbi:MULTISPECIES: HAD family hydrolase [Nocardia]|uniref:HAD family hydrolase n=1 Tax=Nocardia TaxID=1817 RepID=UPI0018942966|nr:MULTISPECIES: HAD-IA family hydrolase [Nocardia]MBF6348548.1 HAD-IA family hydrolase [Nocardia flavorosea]